MGTPTTPPTSQLSRLRRRPWRSVMLRRPRQPSLMSPWSTEDGPMPTPTPWSTPLPPAARTTWESLSLVPMEALLPQLPLLRRSRLRSVRLRPRLILRPGGTETTTTDGTATTPPTGHTTTTHTDTDSTTSADAGTTSAPSSPVHKCLDDAVL